MVGNPSDSDTEERAFPQRLVEAALRIICCLACTVSGAIRSEVQGLTQQIGKESPQIRQDRLTHFEVHEVIHIAMYRRALI